MPAPTTTAIPAEVTEAAALATKLLTRTLKLLDQTITAEEVSGTATAKGCSAHIATIKRVADTLKTLAMLQPTEAAAPTEQSSESPAVPAPVPTASATAITSPAPIPSPRLQPKPPQAPTTRRYGEMLSRR